jgi:hypothetical protein
VGIHLLPAILIIVVLVNNSWFTEHDRLISKRFTSISNSSLIGALYSAKKYSYLATLIPYIVLGASVSLAFYFEKCYGVITYGTMFIIISQLTAFTNEFENYHNMYGAIIAYANPNKLYDRNEKYSEVLHAISQLGAASKGLQVLGLNLAILMSMTKVCFEFTLQVVNVFKWDFYGPIFLG